MDGKRMIKIGEIIKIGNADITVKTYKGQRVVTFKDIDMAHGRPEGTARKRFSDNRKHFIEGEDYFVIYPKDLENQGMSEKRTSGIYEVNARGMALITEQGYLMLVKSFTDDLAWEVQRQLINSYFRTSQVVHGELSESMQLILSMANNLAMKEIEQKRMQEALNKHENAITSIKEAIQPVSDNWREVTNQKISRIRDSVNITYSALRVELYKELESRAGCDLSVRLKNRQERMAKGGISKTEIKKVNKMDIIESDKRLNEIFSKIVAEYEVKYCA